MINKNILGETIIELIITLVIIMLAVTTAFKILTMAYIQNKISKDRVIALNLAREGMEAVRYIRDYNWLYYGNDKRICWNHLEDTNDDGLLNGTDSSCTEDSGMADIAIAESAGGQEYILRQNGTHWFITQQGANGQKITWGDWDTEISTNNAGINADGTDGANSNDYDKSFRICEGLGEKAGFLVSCLDDNADTTKKTKFLRYVKIQYEDPRAALVDSSNNEMIVTTGIRWQEKNQLKNIELVTKLSDFFERTEADGQN